MRVFFKHKGNRLLAFVLATLFLIFSFSVSLFVTAADENAAADEVPYEVDFTDNLIARDESGNAIADTFSELLASHVVTSHNMTVGDTHANYGGHEGLLPAANGEGYVILRFDAGVGSTFQHAALYWSGRAIMQDASWITISVSRTADVNGTWLQVDRIANANIQTTPKTVDLSAMDGARIFYVKIHMNRVSGSWSNIGQLKLTASTTTFSMDKAPYAVTFTDDLNARDESGNAIADTFSELLASHVVASHNMTVGDVHANYGGHEGLLPATNGEGYVILRFDAGVGCAFDDVSLYWSGRAIMQDASWIAISVGVTPDVNGVWTEVDRIANANIQTTPKTVDLSAVDGEQVFYVKIHMNRVSGSWSNIGELAFTANTVQFTISEAPYAVTFTDDLIARDADGAAVADTFSELLDQYAVLSHNMTVGDTSANYGGHEGLLPAANGEGYVILKFDAGAGYAFKDVSLYWSGRAIMQDTSWLAISVGLTDDVDGVWTEVDRIANANIQATPHTVALSAAGGAQVFYVKIHMNRVSGSWTNLGELELTAKTVTFASSEMPYEVDFTDDFIQRDESGTAVADTFSHLLNYHAISSHNITVGDTNANYGGHEGLLPAANGEGYVILKFDAGIGNTFKNVSLYWSGRAIMQDASWLTISAGLTAEVDGAWMPIDSMANANIQNTPRTVTVPVADGAQIFYVKIHMNRVSGSWTNIGELKLTATQVADGTPTAACQPSHLTPTPSAKEALHLLPATGSAAASLNVERIRYCLTSYGYCYLAGGEVFDLSAPLNLGTDGTTLGCAAPADRAELRLAAAAWRVMRVSGTDITVKNLILNYNSQYGTGTSLDKAVLQLYGAATVIDNCVIQGGDAPERKTENKITGVYFLSEAEQGSTVKNSTIKNCFYGVIFRDVLTASQNNQLLNSTVTYNRCDGVTFAGYGVVRDCVITYNGFDCLNPVGGTDYPIPGAGVYTQGTTKGFVLDGCEIAYNNGFNLDINRASNMVITNNYIHSPGWRAFPLAEDYTTVNYGNGISACLTGMRNSTFTGNTVTNNMAANRLDQTYAHLYTGGDVNGYFRATGSSVNFSGLTPGGASVVACALVNYPGENQNYGNTVTGNTFTANTSDSATTGIGLVVNQNARTGNTISGNTDSGSEIGTVYFD